MKKKMSKLSMFLTFIGIGTGILGIGFANIILVGASVASITGALLLNRKNSGKNQEEVKGG